MPFEAAADGSPSLGTTALVTKRDASYTQRGQGQSSFSKEAFSSPTPFPSLAFPLCFSGRWFVVKMPVV